METSVQEQIFTIIEKEIHVDPSHIDANKDLREQISLDSMQFVRIVARLEEAFSIELPISIMEVSTLNEFMAIVHQELPSA